MDEVNWYENSSLESIKNIIKDNINIASRSFVTIGYYLKSVRDRQLYLEDGYQSIWEFAQGEFGIGKSSASQFMSINDKFSKDGNSPILLDEYKDFSSSKLAEMLTMSDEQLGQLKATTTITKIREIKKPKIVLTSEQEKEKAKPLTIDDLDLSVSAYNALHKHGIDTIEKLCEYTEQELLDLKIGDYYVKQIIKSLTENGLNLKTKSDESTKQDSCTGECFYCTDDGCNNHQERRENCLFDSYTNCSIYGAHQVAIETLGIDCKSNCCMSCKEDCGARCNHSTHSSFKNAEIVNDTVKYVTETDEIVNEEPKNVIESDKSELEDKKPEIGTIIYCVGGNSKIKRLEVVSKQSDISKDYFSVKDMTGAVSHISVMSEHWHYTNDDAKKDSWYNDETVEADIIQTEPKKLPKPIFSAKYHLQEAIKREEEQIALMRDSWTKSNPDALLKHETILLALKLHLTDMEYPIPDPVQPVQQELPTLKNNDQRKEWIESYNTWPIWINQEKTGERYYRYEFENGESFVIRVSLHHAWEHGKYSKETTYGCEEYFIIGTSDKYKPDNKTFHESSMNKSAMIDYLKEIQKK